MHGSRTSASGGVNQEFFYPSRATVMSDASRIAASQYLLDGRFVPWDVAARRGAMVVGRILLAPACPRGVLVFPLAGKFNRMRVRCVLVEAARASALFERKLSMESCLVALSTARGDGLSGIESKSWPIKFLHRGANEYSGPCGSVSYCRRKTH